MSARPGRQLDRKDSSVGAISELEAAGLTMIVCMLLIAFCFAAPLLLKRPQAPEASATAGPSSCEAGAGTTPQTTAEGGKRADPECGQPTQSIEPTRLRMRTTYATGRAGSLTHSLHEPA